MKDKDVWGFEWDDPDKAAKEMREEQFGPDREVVFSERFCFECGEIEDTKITACCPFCGEDYTESLKAKKFMAYNIDVAWPLMNRMERDKFKVMVKKLRSVSPEFRAMWQKQADQAAMDRRYANG